VGVVLLMAVEHMLAARSMSARPLDQFIQKKTDARGIPSFWHPFFLVADNLLIIKM
jgi:hypothetical protein